MNRMPASLQISLNGPDVAGGLGPHARGPLHDRLHDERGQAVLLPADRFPGLRHRPLHRLGLAQALLPLVGVGRLHRQGREQQVPVEVVEQVAVADAHGSDGVAVIGLLQPREPGPLGPAQELPVLHRQLERHLHGGGAAVRVEHAGKPLRHQGVEPGGQLDARHVGEPQEGGVGDAVGLVLEGLVQLRAAVAEQVAPQRGDSVEVAVAVDVDEVAALALGDDAGVFAHPLLHLGEGVPQVRVVHALENVVLVAQFVAHLACPKASSACSICSVVWVAMVVTRRREVPGGTVGGRMPCT